MKILLVFWLAAGQPVSVPVRNCPVLLDRISEINLTIEDVDQRLNAACVRVFLSGGKHA